MRTVGRIMNKMRLSLAKQPRRGIFYCGPLIWRWTAVNGWEGKQRGRAQPAQYSSTMVTMAGDELLAGIRQFDVFGHHLPRKQHREIAGMMTYSPRDLCRRWRIEVDVQLETADGEILLGPVTKRKHNRDRKREI